MSEIEGMDELEDRLKAISDTKRMLGRLGLQAVAYGKQLVPRKTGNLGRTIRLGAVSESDAEIIAGGNFGVGYARYVEFGTKPHEIRPRTRRALAWGGRRRLSGSLRSGEQPTTFATRVNHPGTKPQPYLRPAAERAVREAGVDEIVKAWNDAA